MQEYPKSTDIIDWQHPLVLEQALKLSNKSDNPIEIAKRCFEWVRNEIYHSSDFQMNPDKKITQIETVTKIHNPYIQ